LAADFRSGNGMRYHQHVIHDSAIRPQGVAGLFGID